MCFVLFGISGGQYILLWKSANNGWQIKERKQLKRLRYITSQGSKSLFSLFCTRSVNERNSHWLILFGEGGHMDTGSLTLHFTRTSAQPVC